MPTTTVTPPPTTVVSLTVDENNLVTEADQQAFTVTISGTLSAALPTGATVQVVLPSGVPRPAKVAANGTNFSLVLTGTNAIAFSIPGQVSAYVADSAGNQSTPFTQYFVAAAGRTLVPVSATLANFASSSASALALSGDGKSVAFISRQVVGNTVQLGIYVQQLATGVATRIADGSRAANGGGGPKLSGDGHLLAYVVADPIGYSQVYLDNLDTGTATALTAGTGNSQYPSLADDGTVVFTSDAPDLLSFSTATQQVYVARPDGTLAILSAPDAAGSVPGDGTSKSATISADGSTAVFVSESRNLLAPGDRYTASLNGSFQVYAKALRDNPVTGQRAGSVVLVSGNADGSIPNAGVLDPVVSGDGRYVVYDSLSDGQVHLTDLLTGISRIVSTAADGTVGNGGSSEATISADGRTVVFQSTATNLLASGEAAADLTHSPQIYAKNLASGQVTLLSEGGYTPADSMSQDPTISADGSVAAFASAADNLTPGILGSAYPQPISRGYVTSVAGSPALTITAPAATIPTTSLVLTGTIDPAHATTPILITDAADPGFLPVIATVTAGSDPYVDTWTATVIFTRAGAQTVTATAGSATAQATITLLNTPSLTIDPVDGTNAITATGIPGDVTIVTGGNPAGIGGTVSLFLRTADNRLLPLGTATTGANGRWAVSVPNAALGTQSSQSDAIVAETVDSSGNKIRAGQAIALTVPPPVLLYSFRFIYADGSFYTGTVADDGNYAYAPGQTYATSAGRYLTGAAGGTTTQAVGSVTVTTYYDVSTATSYTPTLTAQGAADGAGGLGTETDSISGPGGTLSFGAGVTEARQSAATAYGFAFLYDDGSAYYGSVVGDASSAYQVGQTLRTGSGTYRITGSLGATAAAIGTVNTNLYYDASSAATYVPVSATLGVSSGLAGLGSEFDSIESSPGATTNFGLGGVSEAAFRLVLTYDFVFTYPDGSDYAGRVVDDGTYHYSLNEIIKTQYGGAYRITNATVGSETLGGILLAPGQVFVYTYYDSSSRQDYTPVYYAQGIATGSAGLGTESDFITGDSGSLLFGDGGLYEAKQDPNKLFSFTFTYKDGSSYYGRVVDDGSYGYYFGQTITTPYGHYSIGAGSYLAVGEGGLLTGQVYTRNYFDVTSGSSNVTLYQSANLPSGTHGLLSESDAVLDPTGVYRTFGYGGQYEARLTPYTLVGFEFCYTDGSFYTGYISSDGINGPVYGQIIRTSYGYYEFYTNDGATAFTPGTVTIDSYYDVTDGNYYTPHSFNGNGIFGPSLGTSVGYLDGPLIFGYNGEDEARHAPNTSWEYQFIYPDGSYYIGDVVDNGQSGFHPGFIRTTPYGYYNITGSTYATALPVGSVTIRIYYDVTTRQLYDPVEQGLGGIDGTAGLGSESADTSGDSGDLQFGYGGQYEAIQSDVRHFTFIFRYNDGSFYSGDFASAQHLYLPGTIIPAAGGYYNITAFDDEHSSLPSGTVRVSSYFDIGTGRFYTPVHYAAGQYSGTSDIGSELDYLVGAAGQTSFGGPNHIEARPPSFSTTRLITAAVYAFDGPLQGATVGYLSPTAQPNTLSIDPAQPTAITNADGSYQIDAGTGPLVLTGGTDTATGLPFRGVLESAGTGSVLSPVTTLLEAVSVALGDTGMTAAGTLLSTALGIPAGLDLTTYLPGQILRDPTSSADDIQTAEAVYRAGARLLDAETLIDAAGGHSLVAINTVAAVLANGSVTDLTDLSPLIEDAGLPPPAETAIKTIITATNAAVDQQLAGVTTPGAIIALITGASIALQGAAATALADPNADDAAIADHYVETLPFTLATDDQQAFGVSAACYARGTSILTVAGEVKVEALRIGDHVITASGARRPIRWIGHRRIDCARHPQPEAVRPVRVCAGAFAANMPARLLLLSPDHAVFADGVLIPVKHLINGSTIVQTADDLVEYWHVELDSHDVLLADGLPAESYLDTGNRVAFIEACVPSLHPDFARSADGAWTECGCAPLVEFGVILAAVRARLAQHAAALGNPCEPALDVTLHDAGMVSAMVPAGVRTVRLISAALTPPGDRRRLGAAISALTLAGKPLALRDPGFSHGFHPPEGEDGGYWRWTDGEGILSIAPSTQPRMLEVSVVTVMRGEAA